jgi:tetraacyldisaccharide 4'-kinase
MGFLTERHRDWVTGSRRGPLADLMRTLLWLLSCVYAVAVWCRNKYYDLRRAAVRRPECPVISVGNITVGGTGKTPMAAHVAHLLLGRGLRTAILLRGYKAADLQFDDDDLEATASRWRSLSDEAMVLRRRCPRATILVDADRVKAARQASKRGIEAIVLDDGFQHRRLGRDLDIVLVDATSPFGYGHMLPRGFLREPVAGLRRADLIVVTHSDEIDATKRTWLLGRLAQLAGEKPILQARHRTRGFMDIKGSYVQTNDASHMQAVVFAGIANFGAFVSGLKQLGVTILAAYRFPDHHAYRREELEGIVDAAAELEANVILTTEKDAVKLVGRWPDGNCRLLVLGLEVEFVDDDGRMLTEAIDRALATRTSRKREPAPREAQ